MEMQQIIEMLARMDANEARMEADDQAWQEKI
jgi:hypothetical protein